MIDRPSLLETPNLINWKEYTTGLSPVDDCYANDSSIRSNYDGSDTGEWNTGKQVQETLPAAEWDAWMHDLNAFGWQLTEVINSIYDEIYSAIHGIQAGMSHELYDAMDKGLVRWAEYGVTTFASINTWVSSGYTVFLYTGGIMYNVSEVTVSYITFISLSDSLTVKKCTVDTANAWSAVDTKTLVDISSAQSITGKTIDAAQNTLLNLASVLYPVGSVYLSVVNTNPGTLFGGTWESIGAGKTLVGVDVNDADFNIAEKTGGSKTKTLIEANMPQHTHTATSTSTSTFAGTRAADEGAGSHTHSIHSYNSGSGGDANYRQSSQNGIPWRGSANQCGKQTTNGAGTQILNTVSNHSHYFTPSGTVTTTTTTTLTSAGSGTDFDVMNPYLTVYIWKRVL